MDWSMEESLKSVTTFEHGGYDMDQGNSFNKDNNFSNDPRIRKGYWRISNSPNLPKSLNNNILKGVVFLFL